jgi:radical SAM superfamily enzyme YgiQ (UPF0313 family)
MTKGLLISYAGYPYSPSSLMPDNGLASLAGELIKNNHEVEILDYGTANLIKRLIPRKLSLKLRGIYKDFSKNDSNKLKEIYNFLSLKNIQRKLTNIQKKEINNISQEISLKIKKEKIGFVGLKLWAGDGMMGSKIITKQIKKDHPNVKIFGGGPSSYIFRELLFKHLPIDVLCYDEGENIISDLAKYSEGKKNLADIPSIYYRKNGKIKKNDLEKIIDLDSLAFLVYEKEVYTSIKDKLNIFVIDESRGCRYSCFFCPNSAKEDNKYREKSIPRIINEIEKLSNNDSNYFRFGGQMTTGKVLEEVSKEIIEKKMNVSFSCFGHINGMKNVNFDLLYKAGMKAVFYGIESGSQDILDKAFHKGTRVPVIEDVLNKTKKSGIKTITSFIYPAPFENKKTKQETKDLILNTRPDSVLVYFAGLYPKTKWEKHSKKYGFKITSNN